MSISVDLSSLGERLQDFDSAILITHSTPYVKLLEVKPKLIRDRLIVRDVRQSTYENVVRNPHVTLAWPPRHHDVWTLIVDGVGSVESGALSIYIERATLHKNQANVDWPIWSGL